MLIVQKAVKVGAERVVVISDSDFPKDKHKIVYCMVCPQGNYISHSWISLGWSILIHRLWHLFKHRKWMD